MCNACGRTFTDKSTLRRHTSVRNSLASLRMTHGWSLGTHNPRYSEVLSPFHKVVVEDDRSFSGFLCSEYTHSVNEVQDQVSRPRKAQSVISGGRKIFDH